MRLSNANLVRSKRRSLSIQIDNDGSVTVRAPNRMPNYRIQEFLDEKRRWIKKNVAGQLKIAQKKIVRRFHAGDEFHYLGEVYTLHFDPDIKRRFICDDAFRVSATAQPKAQSIIEKWYKSRARFIFNDRADFYKELMDAPFATVRLSSAKTRWGSCGAKNTLNFNWRLVMAPISVIDSVIVHELAHVHHKNHGKYFWAKVKKHCPNYKDSDVWLKENRHLLEW